MKKINDATGASINEYTFSKGDFDNNGSTDGVITFPAGLNKDIDITVVTDLPSGRDLKTLEDYYAWNKAELNVDSFYDYDEARAEHHTFNNDYTITKDGTFKYDYGTVDGVYGEYPIVEWKVVLNPDQVKLSEDFVPYFFDQLPGGMRPFGNMSISIESYNSARNEVATNTYAKQELLDQRFFYNLPKYDANGNEIKYRVVETAVSGTNASLADFTVSYSPANTTDSGVITVTNTLAPISLKVIKVEKGTTRRLSNAEFQLTRKNAGGTYERFENNAFGDYVDKTTNSATTYSHKGPFSVGSAGEITMLCLRKLARWWPCSALANQALKPSNDGTRPPQTH